MAEEKPKKGNHVRLISMPDTPLETGDRVRLKELPHGYTSRELRLTVGKTYEVQYRDGCCVNITTDEYGICGTINSNSVEKVC